ncbi:MAG: tRNA pseudouridine(55) synthase TruB [Hyphomonadaceae bacterium]|nr:tRNA pseudouridine(55) synthase TruB [Hyphomonadaceae bacterium]MBC6413288.1 tRNA pseudouridine(55) synthase TruB [Hyphomonadaceae bacterium]
MPGKNTDNAVNGWLVLDKPPGVTSTQSVGRVRRIFNAQKAGHGGTLDPLASGVLPVALGEATKTVPFIMDAPKSYTFTLTWGEDRDTLDAEGEVIATSAVRPLRRDVEVALGRFIGYIDQIPPKYSAVRIDGHRAYDLARAGKPAATKSRTIHIKSLEVTHWAHDAVSLEVQCGKGTYVRSLARDLAHALDARGHVTMLRRLRVGNFEITRSFSLDELERLCYTGSVLESLLPIDAPLDDIPVIGVDAETAGSLKHGRSVGSSDFRSHPDVPSQPERVLAKCGGTAVAICDVSNGLLRPRRVFNL